MRESNTVGNGRVCSHCTQFKPLSMFGLRNRNNGQLRPMTYCKPCTRLRSLKWKKSNRRANVAISLRSRYKKLYKISEEDYNLLLDKQGNRCAICDSNTSQCNWKKLGVDHDHKTGQVRGLLCQRCNAALGMLKDDPELFIRAYKYLKASQLIENKGVNPP